MNADTTGGSDPIFEAGARLFDAGAFYEAHEVWEPQWRDADEPDRHFLQGLIQAAAAFHKLLVDGNPRGLHKSLTNSIRNLTPLLPSHRGVCVDELLDALRGWDEVATRMMAGESVPYDAKDLPKLVRERP